MFLGVHILAGAAIGSAVPDPLLSSGLALASHYTLDHLPHWHYLPKYQSNLEDLSKLAIEPLITLPLIVGLAWYFKWDSQIIIPALVASLPDLTEVAQMFIKSKILKWHTRFHEFAHWQISLLPSIPIFASLLALIGFVLFVNP